MVNVGNVLLGQVVGLMVNNFIGIFQVFLFFLCGKILLMVIDGVFVELDFFDVFFENIESINVLKGIVVVVLYGLWGKDGVILIIIKLVKEDGLIVMVGLFSMVFVGFMVFFEIQIEFGLGFNGQYVFWDGVDGGILDGDMIWGFCFVGQKIVQWNSFICNKEIGEMIFWWGDVFGMIYDDQFKYEWVFIVWEFYDNLRDFLCIGIIIKVIFLVVSKSKKVNYNFNGDFFNQCGQVFNILVYMGGLNFNSMYNFSNLVILLVNFFYNKVYFFNYLCYGYGLKNYMYIILLWMGNDVNGKELVEYYYCLDFEGICQVNYNYVWYNNFYFVVNELM